MRTWHNTSLSPEERVDALLAEMDLDAKIHQLGSFWARDPEDEVPAPEPGEYVALGVAKQAAKVLASRD